MPRAENEIKHGAMLASGTQNCFGAGGLRQDAYGQSAALDLLPRMQNLPLLNVS